MAHTTDLLGQNFTLGITGTRSGMNDSQMCELQSLMEMIYRENGVTDFHHGDCVGVDVEAARIAQKIGYRTICHPPIKEDLRAFHESDQILEAKNHFARNRDIVDSAHLLIVVPWQDQWQSRGGTWYTHDYAEKTGVDIVVIWPSEEVHKLIKQGR